MNGWAISVRRVFPWLAMAMSAILLAACVTDKPTAETAAGDPANLIPGALPPPPYSKPFDPGTFKVGNAYQVEGLWYYPKVDLAYEESGIASWYGPNFHGKKTANGEIFDMNLIGAAHKTLPLPSVVRVTNLENGRSLIVRINDRGPFVRGRIIDMSKRAAELLGMTSKGTAMVHVRLLPEESRRAALDAGASGKDLMAFGAPPPKASPSVPVSVEVLAPVEGIAVAMPAPETAKFPQPAPQPQAIATQAAAAGNQPPSAPPPYGAMTAVAVKGPGPVIHSAPAPAPAPAPVAAPAPARAEPIDVAALPTREEVEVQPVKNRPTIFIQAGAFREYVNANRLRARLTSLGHPVNVSQVYVTNQPFFRVRLGPLLTVEDADIALERVVALGYPEALIVVD
ncbi:MAG: septal ring lytic transglycosylase RlpA family protein [Proteobacteria bacterium]|nr:septal ring lytic transglycosylase RlpA family protein [Pseudomonadota bacterium]